MGGGRELRGRERREEMEERESLTALGIFF
jgi:hypothetical protein